MANKELRGLVNKIIPFSNVDGKGNRLSIFLQGCNLNCLYCHNPETINLCNNCMACLAVCEAKALINVEDKIQYNPQLCVGCDRCIHICPNSSSPKTKWYTTDELVKIINDYKPYIQGITISGGEATLYKDFIIQLFKAVGPLGLTCYIDTNGYFDIEDYDDLIKLTDKFLFDIKTLSDQKLIGNEIDLKIPVLNLKHLLNSNKIEEVRTVVVNGSDISKTVLCISKLLSLYEDVEYKLIRVHKTGVRESNKVEIENRLPSDEEMLALVDLAKQEGVKKVTYAL